MNVTDRRKLDRDHDHMTGRAMVIYNRLPWDIGKQDMERNRCEIAEAIVGEDWEADDLEADAEARLRAKVYP